MAIRVKLKINDPQEFRAILDDLYETKSKVEIAQWSLDLAQHILELVDYNWRTSDVIQDGFTVNELWQKEKARMHDVRQTAFKIHRLAKEVRMR